jgi:hypothetical protein
MIDRLRYAHLPWTPVAVAVATVTLGFAAPSATSGRVALRAKAAHSERLSVTAHLHYVDAKGAYLIEEGDASGPLAGVVKARIRVTADISGSFTFYPRDGSLSGRGIGTLHESGIYASFGGKIAVLGGTGRYAHAHGEGGFYGVYDRKTLGVTIQTTGSLSY